MIAYAILSQPGSTTAHTHGRYMKFTLLMKKLIASILYALFALPAFIMSMLALSAYEMIFGFRSFFGNQGDLESILIGVVVTSLIVYLGNRIIQIIDRPTPPRIIDHLQQSVFYYIGLILISIPTLFLYIQKPISQCKEDCHVYIFGLYFALIPLIGIIGNSIFLHRRRKVNII